ncbi:MAG: 1-(5-phosphoribosyl)-5-((5-phosphoribosylamino)methylideneamino) imidazole-4-carboxamide isomerase [Methanosaeta sp. PtaU1.Bin112]|nr:MAG: 1-(5-phosphoribosyl)-5-((5-phosphoribosylamino)methylideneamino) imidazole-4-carboxamide isomerase [Methanosaeta sp. PtaU1.Bin112]
MRCIFVLDILNGAVVHAVRGERGCYEPIACFSRIVSSSEPLGIIQEIRPREVYIADLDLLMGRGDNLPVIEQISSWTKAMADTGISRACELDNLPASASIVLGTETASLSLIEAAAMRKEIIVSIDMKKRMILSRDPQLAEMTPLQLLKRLNDLALQGVILLELDRVGTSAGIDMQFLEEARATAGHPLILGGGVKGEEDLMALEEIGFSGALLATALHNGQIPLKRVQ